MGDDDIEDLETGLFDEQLTFSQLDSQPSAAATQATPSTTINLSSLMRGTQPQTRNVLRKSQGSFSPRSLKQRGQIESERRAWEIDTAEEEATKDTQPADDEDSPNTQRAWARRVLAGQQD